MAAKKKDFTVNPAEMFISSTQADADETASKRDIPKGHKPNPLYIETRSARAQLLIEPSVYRRVKELAKIKDISINELFNRATKEYLERNEG